MNLKTLSSEGKIAYLIKPIFRVLQEAGGQLERSEIKERIADMDDQIAEYSVFERNQSKPETPIKSLILNSILLLRTYSLMIFLHIQIHPRLL